MYNRTTEEAQNNAVLNNFESLLGEKIRSIPRNRCSGNGSLYYKNELYYSIIKIKENIIRYIQ